jgi:biopolymer transport protein ExbD
LADKDVDYDEAIHMLDVIKQSGVERVVAATNE